MGFCFALVAHTYGWTHKEILKLSARQFFMYVEQIAIITSREQLMTFESASFPYMEEKDQKELINHYQKIIDDNYEDGTHKQSSAEKIEENWDLLRRGVISYGE